MGLLRGFAYAVTAAVLWGSLGVAYRLGEGFGASPEWMAVARPLVPSLAAALMAARGAVLFTRYSLAAGLALAVLVPAYLEAVRLLGASLAAALLYTAPAWVAVLSRLLLGEPVGGAGALAVALGVAGAAAVSWEPGAEGNVAGVLWGLASGVSYACYIVAARAAGRRGGGGWLEIGVYSQPVALIGTLAAVRPSAPPQPIDVPWMLYTGVATTLLPYALHAAALRIVEAHRVAVASLAEPATAVLLAYALLGERLTPLQLAGLILIGVAVALAIARPQRT